MKTKNALDTIFDIKRDQSDQDLAIPLNWLDLKGKLNPHLHSENFFDQFGRLAWSTSPVFAVTAVLGGAWLYNLSTQFESQLMASSFQWQSYLGLLEKVV